MEAGGKSRRYAGISNEPYAKHARELVRSQEELLFKLQDLKYGIDKIFREIRRQKENSCNSSAQVLEIPTKKRTSRRTFNSPGRISDQKLEWSPKSNAGIHFVPNMRRAVSMDRNLNLINSYDNFYISPRRYSVSPDLYISPIGTGSTRCMNSYPRARSVAPEFLSSPRENNSGSNFIISPARARSVAPEIYVTPPSISPTVAPRYMVSSPNARSVVAENLAPKRSFRIDSPYTPRSRARSLAPEYVATPSRLPMKQLYSPLLRARSMTRELALSTRASSMAPEMMSSPRACSVARDYMPTPRARSITRESISREFHGV